MLEKILEIQDILEMWDVNLVDSKKINDLIIELLKENQELKKQLEEYKNSQSCSFVNICKSTKIANYYQQKEFVKYLEDEIKKTINTIELLSDTGSCRIPSLQYKKLILEEILQKYKSIIGILDEKK